MNTMLACLEKKMGSIDLDACSDEELSGLVRELNKGRRRLDGYLARIATVARSREAAAGDGGPPDDLFRSNGDVSNDEAERQAKRGNVSDDFPETADKMHGGDALTANMDTLARLIGFLSDSERARLAVFDPEIADRAMSLRPERFTRWLRRLIRSVRDEDGPSTAEQRKAASKVSMGRKRDGMWWLTGELDPERGAELNAAINALARRLAGDRTPTDNTWADALHRLAMNGAGRGHRGLDGADPHGADGANSGGSPRHGNTPGRRCGCGDGMPLIPSTLGIGYIIDAQTLAHGPHQTTVAQTWSGDDHDPLAVQRLACDAEWWAVHLDQLGRPDAVGRTRRSANREQRLALRALYRCCPLDGTPFDRCEMHHVNLAFEHGGATALDNLVPISGDWHHRIHDRGWTLTMNPDRSLELRRPNGRLDRNIPPPIPLTRRRE